MRKKVLINGNVINPYQLIMPVNGQPEASIPFVLHIDKAAFEAALRAECEGWIADARRDDAENPDEHDALTQAGYPPWDTLIKNETLMMLLFNAYYFAEFAEKFNETGHEIISRYWVSEFTGYRHEGDVLVFSGQCEDRGAIIDTMDEYYRQSRFERLLDHPVSDQAKAVLRSIVTDNVPTIILIGLLLDEKSDLNITRLMLAGKDPWRDPETTRDQVFLRAAQKLEGVDQDAVWARLNAQWFGNADNNYTGRERTAVEDTIFRALMEYTDDDGAFLPKMV